MRRNLRSHFSHFVILGKGLRRALLGCHADWKAPLHEVVCFSNTTLGAAERSLSTVCYRSLAISCYVKHALGSAKLPLDLSVIGANDPSSLQILRPLSSNTAVIHNFTVPNFSEA